MSKPKITNERKPNSRKKWISIWLHYYQPYKSNEPVEEARFTHPGDAARYVQQFENSETVAEIIIR